jgi:hypothetical protein
LTEHVFTTKNIIVKIYASIFSLIFVLFINISCDQKPKNPVSEYGDAMIDSYKKGQQAGVTANLDALKKGIEAYRAANDKYPPSLNEVRDLIGSNIDLTQYDYNPENGTVSLIK